MRYTFKHTFKYLLVFLFIFTFFLGAQPAFAGLSCREQMSSPIGAPYSAPANGQAINTVTLVYPGGFGGYPTCNDWCEAQTPTTNNACYYNYVSYCAFYENVTSYGYPFPAGSGIGYSLGSGGFIINGGLSFQYSYRCTYTPDVSAPTATLAANPTSIVSGSSSTLTWSSTDAESCTGTNFSTAGATSGSLAVSPTSNTTYLVSCTNEAGSADDSALVSVTLLACSDGIDNDGDGLTDYPADGGCTSGGGGSEVSQCQDGIDNDGNGLTDLADSGCTSGNDNNEYTTPECQDGLDNNGNGLIDTADTAACTSASDQTEEALPDATLTLLATPALIRTGDPVTLTWSASNASDCSLAGTNGDSWILSGTSGTQVSSNLTSETTFVLACTDLDDDTVSVSATVKITPSFREVMKNIPHILAAAFSVFF